MHELLERYTEAALVGSRAEAADLAIEALVRTRHGDHAAIASTDVGASATVGSPAVVIEQLLAPSQREVGERWSDLRCSVGDEHAATFVTESVLSSVAVGYEPEPHRGTFVMACAEGEWHALPARMASELLILDGWRVIHLGPATPADELRTYLAGIEADAVGISATIPANLLGAARSIGVARQLGFTVIAGGTAFGSNPRRARAIGAHGWTDDLGGGLDLDDDTWDDPADPVTTGPWDELELHSDDIVADALTWLDDRQLWTTDDAAWTAHLVRELREVVAVIAAAVLCDDPSVAGDHRRWLAKLARRSETQLLGDDGYDAVGAVLGTYCPPAAQLLADAG